MTALEEKPVNLKRYYYILGILVFFIFANTIGNGYNLDDELVTRNHKLTSRGLEAVGEIFTSPYYSDAMGYAYGYRPVVHLSFALEHQIFGEKPGTSHFINVLLYVVSVILFFKLLLRWTGERGLVLAIIAVALFAVHPVHTEVVASIKNRDEILAFLFIVMSALALERYSERRKILPLLLAAVLVVLSMLSKKSVFPLVVIFPAAMILLREITLRQVFLFLVVLVLPGALLAAELQWPRFVLLGTLSCAAVLAFYFIKNSTTGRIRQFSAVALLAGSALLTTYAFKINNPFYLLPAVPMTLGILLLNFQLGILFLSVQSAVCGYFFQCREMSYFALFVAAGYALLSPASRALKVLQWSVVAMVAGVFLIDSPNVKGIFSLLAISVFYLLLRRKILWALAWAVVAALPALLSKSAGPELAFMPVIALFCLADQGKDYRYTRYFPALGFAACMVVLSLQSDVFANRHDRMALAKQPSGEAISRYAPDTSGSFLKEGRRLEYVENTLTIPHTQAESIGTGSVTMGEYLRLMVFPSELSFYYGYAKTQTVALNNVFVWLSLIVHVFLIVLAGWQLKKRPLISIGIAWYLLSILLFSNWVELVAGMVGERLAFTASAGFCLFAACLLTWAKPDFSFRKPGWVEYTLMAAVLLLTVRTVVRNADWKNPLTLMSHDIDHLQSSAQANNLYAMNLMRSSVEDAGQTREEQIDKQKLAVQHFDRALQVWPGFFNAAYDKGRAAMAVGDTASAISGFEQAVEIGNADFLDPYYQLGDLYLQRKRNKDFLALSKKIFAISDNSPNGYSVLARGYFVNNYADSAKITLQKGVLKFPDNADLQKNLEMIGVK